MDNHLLTVDEFEHFISLAKMIKRRCAEIDCRNCPFFNTFNEELMVCKLNSEPHEWEV